MDKKEILERNKKSSRGKEDEREQFINGKAGITAKIILSLIVVLLIMFKHYKYIPVSDIWAIYAAYIATELFCKYYYLKDKKIFLYGIFFSTISIFCLVKFIISACI